MGEMNFEILETVPGGQLDSQTYLGSLRGAKAFATKNREAGNSTLHIAHDGYIVATKVNNGKWVKLSHKLPTQAVILKSMYS